MKKRDFFYLLFIILFSLFFLLSNKQFFFKKTNVKIDSLIEDTLPYFVSALQKGNPQAVEKVFKCINKVDYPVVLFNLTMNPVVWNNSSLNYDRDYIIVKTIDIFGNPIGYLGVGKRQKEKDSGKFINLWIYFLVIFLIVSFWKFKPAEVFALAVFVLGFAFTGGFLPIVLFFALLYISFGEKYIDKKIASIVFFSFSLAGFFYLFSNPFVFYDLIVFLKNPDFFQFFFSFLLSSVFFLNFEKNVYVLFVVFLGFFAGFYLFAFAMMLFLISLIMSRRIGVFILKLLLLSIFLALFGHFYSSYKVKQFVRNSDFSYQALKREGEEKVRGFLSIASSKGFASLKDFIERSGLKDFDYFVAYINVVGEVVEEYSNNLPEIMDIPEKISSFKIQTGDITRFVVSGSGRFKVGRIVIVLASDVYSDPFLKRHPEIFNYIQVEEGKDKFKVKVSGTGYFNILSDLSLFFIVGIVFFLVVSSFQRKKGLFDRVVFSIYLGFSVIFVVLGLILFLFSNKIAKGVIEKSVENNLKKIEALIEEEPNKLSNEYLQWLKEVFDVNIGVYANGVLHFYSDRQSLSLLMPFPVFSAIKSGNGDVFFYNGVAFRGMDIKEIPFAILSIKEKKDFNPLYEFLRIVAFVFFIVFIVSYFVSLKITKNFVSPLIKLSSNAKSVAKGVFKVEVDYENEDEIKELIDAISYMAESLKQNYDRLKTIIDNVSSGIILVDSAGNIVLSNNAFNLMEEKLKEKVLNIENVKEFDFEDRKYIVYRKAVGKDISMVVVEDLTDVVKASKLEIITDIARKVAHDIKNPLTPIKLNIDYLLSILKKKEMNIEEVLPGIAENILQKVEELKNISSQFSGIFKASKDLTLESIDIKDFLENLFKSYPGLQYEIKGESVNIYGNKLKLTRIFENLIENSISFSDSPFVRIFIQDEGEFVKIVYKDNGMGINKDYVDKIFEPYFSTREEGTGLGLFIVREFIKEMNGEIKAFPSKEGGHFELKFRKDNF